PEATDPVADTLRHRGPPSAQPTPHGTERTRGAFRRRGGGPRTAAGPLLGGRDDRTATGTATPRRRRGGLGRSLCSRGRSRTSAAGGTGGARARAGCHGRHS